MALDKGAHSCHVRYCIVFINYLAGFNFVSNVCLVYIYKNKTTQCRT